MNIKTKLKIIIFFVVVVSIFFSFSIYFSLQNYQKALKNETIAVDIAYLVFERRYLAEQYLAYPNERIKSQWFAKQDVLKALVSFSKEDIDTGSEKYGTQISERLNQSENIFGQIIKLDLENTGSTPSAFLQEKKTILSSQLALKAQETVSLAAKVEEINRENVQQLLDQIIFLFSAVASLFLLMLLVSFAVIWGSTKKLDESNQRFNFVSQATQDIIYDWDLKTNKVWFSSAIQKAFGYKPEEVSQTLDWWLGLLHWEDKDRVNKEVENMIKGNKTTVILDYRFKRADGTYANVQDRAYLIRNSSGKPIRYVGVLEDITKLKELEKLKDEFVSVASHELRTPMTAIKGFISMILEGDYGEVQEKLKEPLKDIATSTERLINLVNDMLNVSRIEAGRLKFVLTEISINNLINEVVKSLQPIAQEKNIQLTSVDMSNISVLVDTDKIKQVLNNLIGNALKFIEVGSITVSAQQENDMVKISIKDTGIGISKEDAQKLFGKFNQISSVQRGRPTGTGLGLYISRELIRKLGGDLVLEESTPGVGSTFSFTLPVAGLSTARHIQESLQKESESHPDQKGLENMPVLKV